MATNNQVLLGLYAAVDHRAPDKAAYDSWISKLNAGTSTIKQAAIDFSGHANWVAAYPTTVIDSAYVNTVYLNVLGISGDTAGRGFWTNLISNKTLGRADFFSDFISAILDYDPIKDVTSNATEKAAALLAQTTFKNRLTFSEAWINSVNASDPTKTGVSNGGYNAANDQSVKFLGAITDNATLTTQLALLENKNPTSSAQISLSTPVSLNEGNSGLTPFTFTANRTGDSTGASSANYVVSGGTATADDFEGGSFPKSTVSFAAGETSKSITINVVGDTNFEPDETFTVTLSAPTNATLGTATATGTITNDDNAQTTVPTINLSVAPVSLNEGNSGLTPFIFTATRTGDSTGASSANYVVSGGTATADDFEGGSFPKGTVSFAAGKTTSDPIKINVVGDTNFELDETFTVTLSTPTNATLGTATATGTITNDDNSAPTLSFTPISGATAGADRLEDIVGNNILDGGAGDDTAVFLGSRSEWEVLSKTDQTLKLTATGEVNKLVAIELIQFIGGKEPITIAVTDYFM